MRRQSFNLQTQWTEVMKQKSEVGENLTILIPAKSVLSDLCFGSVVEPRNTGFSSLVLFYRDVMHNQTHDN